MLKPQTYINLKNSIKTLSRSLLVIKYTYFNLKIYLYLLQYICLISCYFRFQILSPYLKSLLLFSEIVFHHLHQLVANALLQRFNHFSCHSLWLIRINKLFLIRKFISNKFMLWFLFSTCWTTCWKLFFARNNIRWCSAVIKQFIYPVPM